MRQQFHAYMMTIALLASTGLAMAQAPNATPRTGHAKLNLSQQQKQAVDQGLKNEQTQSSPAGDNAQVGTKLPNSLTAHPMPNNITQQVPETRTYLFVKLPDRVLMIDPADQTIAEIIPVPATTGAGNPAPR